MAQQQNPETYFIAHSGKLKNIIKNYYTTKKGYRGVQVLVILEDCIIQDCGKNTNREADDQKAKHLAIEIQNSEINQYWGGLEHFEKTLWDHEDPGSDWVHWYDCHLESVEYNGKWFTKVVCDSILGAR